MLYFVAFIYILVKTCSCAERLESWNYVNMHCRDNENNPVDWWYLYKPPPSGSQPDTDGLNFTFLAPGKRGFTASSKSILSSNMLHNTLAPFYKQKYKNYLAAMTYKESGSVKGVVETPGFGILMADEKGGVWISHSVPNLLDLTGRRKTFPIDERNTGHMITCLSLNLSLLNHIAGLVREIKSTVLSLSIPINMRKSLPRWLDLRQTGTNKNVNRRSLPKKVKNMPVLPLEFQTLDKSTHGMILYRRPGENRCLYKTFASYKGLILDVYQHDTRVQPFCEPGFGVRNIDSISLKYEEGDVFYVNNMTDKANFAVSTGAVWQTTGKNKSHWACTSNVEKQDGGYQGGFAVCVESYPIWWAFTNFKVSEPQCPTEL